MGSHRKKNGKSDFSLSSTTLNLGRSAVKIPQTMAGVQVAPELGVVWDTPNKVNVGVNLLHEYGSPNVIDRL